MMTAKTGQTDLEAAVDCLRRGGVIALPTDTLYALAADARDSDAVRRVYRIKGREDGKPLPLFVPDLETAARYAVLTDAARRLATRFWPGALTIVCMKQPGFDSEALAGGDTVALRVPDYATALEVLRALGGPVTGTSANRSGGPDPDTADEVRRQLGDEVDLVLDAGACPGGVSSTIIDCSGDTPRILRHGAIPEADVFTALQQEAPSP
jgi:L-threonylcarbamoyladenylate synthase